MKTLKLFVGDLCYVHNDDEWDAICEQMSSNENWDNLENDNFSLCGTHYGDGKYEGKYCPRIKDWTSYPVDSGTIGAIWVDKISRHSKTHLGHIFEVEVFDVENRPKIRVTKDDSGVIEVSVGSKVIETIDTNPYHDDEIEEWDDEDDEDWDDE